VSLLDSDYEIPEERAALQHTLERLEAVNADGLLPDYLRVADMHSPSVADVMRAMTEHAREGCTLLCVDYVQQIEGMGADAEEGGARELSRVVGALKRHAKHLGCPLLLMSQFNRGKKVGEEAVMSDMKGSSTIEQASEAIVLLWRASKDEMAPTLGKVAKLKSSARRPRFQLVRNGAGVVTDAAPYEPESGQGSAADRIGELQRRRGGGS
jgi:replicative DNA helicase